MQPEYEVPMMNQERKSPIIATNANSMASIMTS